MISMSVYLSVRPCVRTRLVYKALARVLVWVYSDVIPCFLFFAEIDLFNNLTDMGVYCTKMMRFKFSKL